ncbi:ankyrin repeat protein [Deinobacterium chartae]|uniref:Ankyrin repeat protein n=1 Tax=Deinobacterium chartae TaxID=521158 RepID=A0A841HUC4_9DEIO|nr:ankyrin repeat domain-containing protein [Deinobacterium chartae]MBB6097041.1 ankyrin repeat protein [Deinobacterium chartae]
MSAFESPLHELVAHAHGNAARVAELLEAHPELLEERYAAWNETPMEAAAHTGSRDVAELLMARGARPTHGALAMLGRADDLRAALEAQPSLAHTPGAHGISLLYHAALSGDPRVLEVAWGAGAREGLDHAVHASVLAGSADALRWLLARGARLDAPNAQGKTPLAVARARGADELVAVLEANRTA